MTQQEIMTIGLSEHGDGKLSELRAEGVFAEKMDGFRFAAALALAQGVIPPELSKRSPFVNHGSLDPGGTLKRAVETLMPNELVETTPYRMIERLAEWGVNELYEQHHNGGIDFVGLFAQVERQAKEQ